MGRHTGWPLAVRRRGHTMFADIRQWPRVADPETYRWMLLNPPGRCPGGHQGGFRGFSRSRPGRYGREPPPPGRRSPAGCPPRLKRPGPPLRLARKARGALTGSGRAPQAGPERPRARGSEITEHANGPSSEPERGGQVSARHFPARPRRPAIVAQQSEPKPPPLFIFEAVTVFQLQHARSSQA